MSELERQLEVALSRGELPVCEHDEVLMGWDGARLRTACGCTLGDDGMVTPGAYQSAAVHKPRTMSEELSQQLAESVIWINLRTKLVTLLQHEADHGDENARSQMAFMSTRWTGGQAPRHTEVGLLRTRIQDLERWAVGVIDGLEALGLHPTKTLDRAAKLGIPVHKNQGDNES